MPFFAFPLENIELDKIARVRLSLNSVPTGLGEVVTMPPESTIQLYGISDGPDEQWQRSGFMKWNDAPKIENAVLLGSFTISRAKLKEKSLLSQSNY